MYLYPYKKEWPDDFKNEVEFIRSEYHGVIKLRHIGSTAVEGMYSKDCIDILGVVENIQKVKENVFALEKIGFKYKGSYGIDGREYFSKSKRKVHLHIFKEGHAEIVKHLGFVEIMRGNPTLVNELNSLKRMLHAKYPLDKDSYQKEKIAFYNEIHKML